MRWCPEKESVVWAWSKDDLTEEEYGELIQCIKLRVKLNALLASEEVVEWDREGE